MNNKTYKAKEKTIIAKLQERLVVLTLLTVGAFIIIQFVILSSVGTIGPKISRISNQVAQLQLDNEIKIAQIRQDQTNSQVQQSAISELQMHPTTVKYITSATAKLGSSNVVAQK